MLQAADGRLRIDPAEAYNIRVDTFCSQRSKLNEDPTTALHRPVPRLVNSRVRSQGKRRGRRAEPFFTDKV